MGEEGREREVRGREGERERYEGRGREGEKCEGDKGRGRCVREGLVGEERSIMQKGASHSESRVRWIDILSPTLR